MSTFNSDANRLEQLGGWLQTVLGTANLSIEPASADASFRRYFRITRGAESFVCMDAPVDYEDTEPFIRVASMLGQAGIRVPTVLAANTELGFLLLRDLGTQTYLDAIEQGRSPGPLYDSAISTLVVMHASVEPVGLGVYDEQRLHTEMALFDQWFLGPLIGLALTARESGLLQQVKDSLVAVATGCAQGFVHRDYHSRNLMVGSDNEPGVLDFQDAVCGPMVYDLVSLLRDSYLRWPTKQINEWIQAYEQQARQRGVETGTSVSFRREFDLVGAQRHLKVCGIFARLYLRDAKAAYLKDIPLTLEHLQNALRPYPEYAHFCLFLRNRVAPAMTDALQRLAQDGAGGAPLK